LRVGKFLELHRFLRKVSNDNACETAFTSNPEAFSQNRPSQLHRKRQRMLLLLRRRRGGKKKKKVGIFWFRAQNPCGGFLGWRRTVLTSRTLLP
jgi:hypothetical protein